MESIEIYNGDCLKILDSLIQKKLKVDLILTDLPYGTTSCSWDQIIPFEEMWKRIFEIRKDNTAILLFGMEPFSSLLRCSNLKEYRYNVYWEKERITNIFQCKRRFGKIVENISIFYKNQPTYNPQMIDYFGPKRGNKIDRGLLGKLIDTSEKKPLEYKDTGKRYPTQILKFQRDILTSNLHPTQKPVALLEFLIKTFSNENDIVLDFTMGSGSTGIACKNLNRKFVGIEKDSNYFQIAKNRLNTYDKDL